MSFFVLITGRQKSCGFTRSVEDRLFIAAIVLFYFLLCLLDASVIPR
jgi:hypothetical protein